MRLLYGAIAILGTSSFGRDLPFAVDRRFE
jgi:hypothetical protein